MDLSKHKEPPAPQLVVDTALVNGLNGQHDDDFHDDSAKDSSHPAESMQLSPNRRRSHRVSAMRAAEKIKHADDPVDPNRKRQFGHLNGDAADALLSPSAADAMDTSGEGDGADDSRHGAAAPRRLAADLALDQADSHFAIRLDADGTVVALSDDSEISSLDEHEIGRVRDAYNKSASEQQSAELLAERAAMVAGLEAELRLEEAKLLLVKKLRMSQQMPAGGREALANAGPTTAYGGAAAHTGRTAHANTLGQSVAAAAHAQRQQLPPQQSRQVNSVPAVAPAVRGTAAAHSASPAAATTAAPTPPLQSQSQVQRAEPQAAPTPPRTSTPQQTHLDKSQKQMAVKFAMRGHMQKVLQAMEQPQPVPANDVYFVPSHSTPDFLALCGLDLVVSKVLRDKSQTEPALPSAWRCHRCGADFTPDWHASDENELRCQQCESDGRKRIERDRHEKRLDDLLANAAKREAELEQKVNEVKDLAQLNFSASALQQILGPRMGSLHQNTPEPSSSYGLGPSGSRHGSSSNVLRDASSASEAAAAAAIRASTMAQAATARHRQQAEQQHQQQAMVAMMKSAAASALGLGAGGGGGAASGRAANSAHQQMADQMAAAAQLQRAAAMFNPQQILGWNANLAAQFPTAATQNLVLAALAQQAPGILNTSGSSTTGGGGGAGGLSRNMMRQLTAQQQQHISSGAGGQGRYK